jgi:hypothetical protein
MRDPISIRERIRHNFLFLPSRTFRAQNHSQTFYAVAAIGNFYLEFAANFDGPGKNAARASDRYGKEDREDRPTDTERKCASMLHSKFRYFAVQIF